MKRNISRALSKEFMKRKAIRLNPSTLCISLPAKWVKANDLKKGEELDVDIEGKELRVSKEGATKRYESVHLDIVKGAVFDKNMISGLYQAGVDEIRATFPSQEIFTQILERVRDECIGFDILEQNERSCVIRSISTEFDIDFDQIFRKNMQLMLEMVTKLCEIVEKKEFEKLPSLRALEKLENKLQGFCLRYVSKHGYPPNPRRSNAAYAFIREIENITDDYKRICDELIAHPATLRRETLSFMKRVRDFTEALYKAFSGDGKGTKHLYEERARLFGDGCKLLRTSTKEGVILFNLTDAVSRIWYANWMLYEMTY